MEIEFSLALPRDAFGIPMVRRVLGNALRTIGVAEDCVSDILLAVSEACANAVRHGGPAQRYEVTAAIRDGRCELRVVDRGPGLSAIPERFPPGDTEHGRGILIMQSVVEEECTGNGALACLHRGFRAEAAIIPEPFDHTILQAQVGVLVTRMTRVLPGALGGRVAHLVGLFVEGMAVMRDPVRLGQSLLLSAPLWLSIASGIWAVMIAFHMTIPFTGSFLVVALLVVGVAVPTPGAGSGLASICLSRSARPFITSSTEPPTGQLPVSTQCCA